MSRPKSHADWTWQLGEAYFAKLTQMISLSFRM